MPVTSDVYFLDNCKDADGTQLRSHAPDYPPGGLWSLALNGRLEISGNKIAVASGFSNGRYAVQTGDTLSNRKYAEQGYWIELQGDTTSPFFCGDVSTIIGGAFVGGWGVRWRPRAGGGANHGDLRLEGHGVSITIDVPLVTSGTHLIRIIGEEETLTAYLDNYPGVRITDIPSFQTYDQIGISMDTNYKVTRVYGKAGVEPDYTLYFDTDFGPVGGPSGSGGGGGGSGGSPSSGGSNPSDVPCDPNTTLVINNGQVVSVAPTNPCQWTGLIWWKLVCGEVLTADDYAVESEVYFNTLTDLFMSVGVIARLNESTGGHYWATLWNDEIAIGKRPSEGADDILLGYKLLTLQAGRYYKIRLEVEGFTLRAYLDDVLQVTAVDLNESFADAGCAGIRLSRSNPATDIRFDNFRVWLNVIRPSFAELPVFLESISVLKDDGMTTDYNIGLADSLNASEALTLLTPKTVHINEGIIFDDLPKQVKKIQEFVQALDAMDPIGAYIALSDAFTGNDSPQMNMNIPISEVFAFTDEDRAIHGINETMTIGEYLISLAKESGALDSARASDTVKITRTSTATFVKPEQTYEARALKTIFTVDDAKRVN